MEHIDTLVIGAGVVGLATAAKLSQNQDVIVIEQGSHFGEHTSSRNSEVIHAGIYYPSNSGKAQHCVEGKTLLYQHCKEYGVPFAQLGKVITAQTADEAQTLEVLFQQAKHNGVTDLYWLSKAELQAKAPQVHAREGLFSPSTGIVDSHQLMLSLIAQLERNQGQFVPNTEFVAAHSTPQGFAVELNCGGEIFQLSCTNLINAGGLFAQQNAAKIAGLNHTHIPPLHYCRGQYFSYQGKHPFKHLIYPVPQQHGLGIHATLDLAGQLRFGPDTQFIESLDYTTDSSALETFYQAIRRYWPSVDKSRLQIDYAGIRPKLQTAGPQDFVIDCEVQHGVKGLINLFGIESPGLTACLSIAKLVTEQLEPSE
ncbi:NAD(P)/FAD-dependent oxidoreductase [Pseudoalteromonas obscura]|uniref:NAD(P)/FAD-dependent oxidoreductase n=1 Tax=Pseudoalteromonas obscura TaxID=3048491 RepID=A0ABT7ESP9_9GAMM|nr:NAD(P)/FAD-dependent oxidoreductase [Pseudoalteromonas sp. P94(2023)]MDK2598091.1 NAD(P)/FAD-dependent oxidoreductase [Pseudoalteromonas sp. P94(2023)]